MIPLISETGPAWAIGWSLIGSTMPPRDPNDVDDEDEDEDEEDEDRDDDAAVIREPDDDE